MHGLREIARQPGEEEIEGVAIGGEPDGQPPDLAVAQEVAEHAALPRRGRAFRRAAAGNDVVMLRLGELRILARISIDEVVGDEIQKAQQRGDAKTPAPAVEKDHIGDQRHADHVGEFGGGIEDRSRARAFVERKPMAGRLLACRKGRCFRDAEQQARAGDAPKPAGERGDGGGDRPEEAAGAADRGDAEAVEHHAAGDLQQRIGPEERAAEQADVGGGEAELLGELGRRGGEPDAIDVVDENSDAEETTDHPASPGYLLACIRHFESSLGTQGRVSRPRHGERENVAAPAIALSLIVDNIIL